MKRTSVRKGDQSVKIIKRATSPLSLESAPTKPRPSRANKKSKNPDLPKMTSKTQSSPQKKALGRNNRSELSSDQFMSQKEKASDRVSQFMAILENGHMFPSNAETVQSPVTADQKIAFQSVREQTSTMSKDINYKQSRPNLKEFHSNGQSFIMVPKEDFRVLQKYAQLASPVQSPNSRRPLTSKTNKAELRKKRLKFLKNPSQQISMRGLQAKGLKDVQESITEPYSPTNIHSQMLHEDHLTNSSKESEPLVFTSKQILGNPAKRQVQSPMSNLQGDTQMFKRLNNDTLARDSFHRKSVDLPQARKSGTTMSPNMDARRSGELHNFKKIEKIINQMKKGKKLRLKQAQEQKFKKVLVKNKHLNNSPSPKKRAPRLPLLLREPSKEILTNRIQNPFPMTVQNTQRPETQVHLTTSSPGAVPSRTFMISDYEKIRRDANSTTNQSNFINNQINQLITEPSGTAQSIKQAAQAQQEVTNLSKRVSEVTEDEDQTQYDKLIDQLAALKEQMEKKRKAQKGVSDLQKEKSTSSKSQIKASLDFDTAQEKKSSINSTHKRAIVTTQQLFKDSEHSSTPIGSESSNKQIFNKITVVKPSNPSPSFNFQQPPHIHLSNRLLAQDSKMNSKRRSSRSNRDQKIQQPLIQANSEVSPSPDTPLLAVRVGDQKLKFQNSSVGEGSSSLTSEIQSDVTPNTQLKRGARFTALGLSVVQLPKPEGHHEYSEQSPMNQEESQFFFKLCRQTAVQKRKSFMPQPEKKSLLHCVKTLNTKQAERNQRFTYTNTLGFQQFELDNYDLNWSYTSKHLFENKNLLSEKNQLMSAAVLKVMFSTFYELKYSPEFRPLPLTVSPSHEEQLLQSYEINFKKSNLPLPLMSSITTDRNQFKPDRTILEEFQYYILQMVNKEKMKYEVYLQEQEEALKLRILSSYSMKMKKFFLRTQVNAYAQWIASFDANLAVAGSNRDSELDEKWLIKIIDPSKLDQLQTPILLKSLITKTEVEGVSYLLDWMGVEEKMHNFESRITQMVRKQANLLQQIMNDIHYEWVFALEFEKVKCKFNIQEEVIRRVACNASAIRLLPLSLVYKSVDFQKGKLLEWVMEKVFWGELRFNGVSHQQHIDDKIDKIQKNEIANIHKLDSKQMIYQFDDYPAYAYIFNKNYETFANMVFKHKNQTIYKHLHQSENDSIMYALTQHLFTQTCYRFYKLPIMTSGTYEKLFGFQGALEYKMPIKRAKSHVPLVKSRLRQHTRASRQVANKEVIRKQLLRAHSLVGTDEKFQRAPQLKVMKRQNAINYFNRELCEYLIHELLHRGTRIVKGKWLLFFNRPFQWITYGDPEFKRDLMGNFAFKSNVAKDFEFPTMIMEVLKPIEVQAAYRKIDTYSRVIRTKKMTAKRSVPILKQWKEKDHFQQPPKKMSKELMYYEPEKFETDESMRDIKFDDVKSDYSHECEYSDDDSQYSSIMKENKKCLLMSDKQTALQYYNQLGKKQKRQPVKLNVFKALKASEFDKHDGIKRNKTLNQIQQMLIEAKQHISADNKKEKLINKKDQNYFDEIIRKCFETSDFKREFFKITTKDESDKSRFGREMIRDYIMRQIPPFSELIDGSNKYYLKKISKLISNGINPSEYFIQEEHFGTENEIKLQNMLLEIEKQKRLLDLRKQYKIRFSISHKQAQQTHRRSLRIDMEKEKLRSRLHDQMEEVNDFLGLNDGIRRAEQGARNEVKALYKEPEKQKAFKREVFITILSKDYTKIEDMFRRYYITSENIRTDHGDNLLMIAAHIEDVKLVVYLLNKGFDTNIQNNNGDTALHFAMSRKQFNIADALIHFGADELIRNNQGIAPWDMVQE